jgi:hypothetical protein
MILHISVTEHVTTTSVAAATNHTLNGQGRIKTFSPLHSIQTGYGGTPNLLSNRYRG